MKIQALNKNVKSIKLHVPVDGLINIDENGIAEVSAKCGKMLIEGTNDWEEVTDGKVTNKTKKVEEHDDKAQTDDDLVIIEGLKSLSLDECIKTAKDAGYPEKEWEKFSKNEKAAEKLMRNYLIKKYKDSVKA